MSGFSLKYLKISFYLAMIILTSQTHGTSFEEDIRLTAKEKEILDKFKDRVLLTLPHDHMKEDIYLVRWLRAKNFNVDQAEQMLSENLQWRKANNMDNINEEDWADFDLDYPMRIDGVDKEGRPVVWLELSQWDIRKAVVAGQLQKLVRQFERWSEIASNTIREMQSQGQNVTQVVMVLNLLGVNVVQHVNPICFPFYLQATASYEAHFPHLYEKFILVNSPQIFQLVIDLARPIMSPATRAGLKSLGTNSQDWGGTLYKWIDFDQLPKSLGGTKENIL